jgi:uncharacterized membrane protein YozB (DUF420 family)
MDTSFLPHVNASLNATSGILITAGFIFIKKGRREAHRRCMVAAVCSSALFLISYIIYHYTAKITLFAGQGWIRPVYFTILISHTALAVVLAPLVVMTVRRAVRGEFERHRRLAKITFPLWLYVSVTGVVVYWFLYHGWPSDGAARN